MSSYIGAMEYTDKRGTHLQKAEDEGFSSSFFFCCTKEERS